MRGRGSPRSFQGSSGSPREHFHRDRIHASPRDQPKLFYSHNHLQMSQKVTSKPHIKVFTSFTRPLLGIDPPKARSSLRFKLLLRMENMGGGVEGGLDRIEIPRRMYSEELNELRGKMKGSLMSIEYEGGRLRSLIRMGLITGRQPS